MPDEQFPELPDAPSITDFAGAVADAQLDPARLEKQQKHAENVAVAQKREIDKYRRETGDWILEWLAKKLIGITDIADVLLDPLARGAIESLLKPGEGGKHGTENSGGRLISKLSGSASSVEPGIDGAARYLTIFINESVEAWLRGVAVEIITEYAPKLAGIGGGVQNVQHLQEIIEGALGGSRMVRRVLQPFISATAITPAQWHVNKRYRPELLPSGAAIEAYTRGSWDFEKLSEELARQGFDVDRIQQMILNSAKRLTVAELVFLNYRGAIDEADILQRVRYLGYDEVTARSLIEIERTKLRDKWLAPVVDAAVDAYADKLIDEPQLRALVEGSAPTHTEAQFVITAADAKRQLRVKRISSTRMRAIVLDGIASVVDFRKALQREGYPEDDIVLEELALRLDLKHRHDLQQKDPTIAQLEAAVLAGVLSLDDFRRAAPLQQLTEQGRAVTISVLEARLEKQAADLQAKADADAERAARDAEIAAKRARAFPSLQEYRRAYVRGFIARDVYGAALEREKVIGDDAAFLLSGADDEREQFLADEEKRQQQLAAGEQKNLGIATLEQAVLAGELEVSGFDSYLAKVGYTDDDRRLLVRLVRDKLEDQAIAKSKRDAAEQLAGAKSVSLADWERAVRLGVRTIAQYAGFLDRLGLDAPARSLILDVLGAQLSADQEARTKRDARDAAAQQQGLSLAQRRRAVIAGVRPRTDYEAAIRAAGWSVDDQLADLDLLDVEIAAAAAARARRDAVVEKAPASLVSIAQLEHALVLGLLTPPEFRAALLDRGASDADADLLTTLAIAKVPDARAGVQLHDQVQRELEAKGVSLAEIEAAVRRGIVTLDDFALDLTNRGYAGDAVQLLRQLLEERIGVDVDELRTKIAAALTKAGAAFTLDELDAALAAGEIDLVTFQGAIVDNGAPRDAALVYSRLRGV